MTIMDRRRILLALAAAGASLALPGARAQAPAKLPRVALFNFGSRFNARSRTDAFVKAMRDLGYEDGKNVHYESRHANGQPDLLRDLAVELSRANVDVVVSASTITTDALLHATSAIPIVMATVEDPVLSGFVKSLARPETNVTGLTTNAVELVPRHMDLLLKAVPGLGKAAALVNPGNAIYAPYRARLEATARSARVRLTLIEAGNYRDIEQGFKGLAAAPVGGLIVMSDSSFYTERSTITELAARFRVPAVYPQQGFVDAGGLMSYGQSLEGNYVRAASYVDRILKGEKPAEMAIEQPANYELIVNRNAARSLGLALSNELLKRANKVIG
jgi:putative ABC transport system substrate-binding protein